MAVELQISLCMIVKDEEAFLDASLKSSISLLCFDDIVIVDTGSTDKTKEIAHDNGVTVFSFDWCSDFSAARNFAASKAVNDWILMLDADETVLEADLSDLSSFISSANENSVGSIKVVAHPDSLSSNISRLYNRKHHIWNGKIHEQLVPTGENKNEIVTVPITVIHYGYSPEVKKDKRKFERNLYMLENSLVENPDDPYLLAQLGKCYYVNNEDLNKACDYFYKALSFESDFRLEYVYITVLFYGYSLLNTEQYEKALIHINKYANHYADTKAEFRFLMAHIYQNNGLFQEAVECYESCIGIDMPDPEGITSYLSYYNIGVILECVGMIEDAADMYRNCGDYKPAVLRLDNMTKRSCI